MLFYINFNIITIELDIYNLFKFYFINVSSLNHQYSKQTNI